MDCCTVLFYILLQLHQSASKTSTGVTVPDQKNGTHRIALPLQGPSRTKDHRIRINGGRRLLAMHIHITPLDGRADARDVTNGVELDGGGEESSSRGRSRRHMEIALRSAT
jgi:hypothetical protein